MVDENKKKAAEMRRAIQINIVGEPGSGKTALATEISTFLRSRGFDVHVDDIDLNNGLVRSELVQASAIESIADTRKIILKTKQSKRSK